MQNNQVFDYYDTLMIYQQKVEPLIWSNKLFLSEKHSAFVCQSKINFEMFKAKTIGKQHQIIQNSVPIEFYNKISLLKEKYPNNKQCLQKMDDLIQKLRVHHVNLNCFHNINILSKHQIKIQSINRKIHFGKIIYFKFQQFQSKKQLQKNRIQKKLQKKSFENELQKNYIQKKNQNKCIQKELQKKNIEIISQYKKHFFDFRLFQSIIQQAKQHEIKIKFNTVEQIIWILIMFQKVSLKHQNAKMYVNQQNQVIKNHPILFQELHNRFGLKLTSKLQCQQIKYCIDSQTLMPFYCKHYLIQDLYANDQIQGFIQIQRRQLQIIQPIVNYYYFQFSDLGQIQNQFPYFQKRIEYKYPLIGQLSQQKCTIVFKIAENGQIFAFSGLGKSLKYLFNVLKIFVRKKCHLDQILEVISQQLTFDDIIQIYEVTYGFQYPKL